jgi:Ca2+-binding RTX toxin-like protein
MNTKTVSCLVLLPLLFTAAAVGAQTCNGLAATITGTADADDIAGTSGPDVIIGLGGDDRIEGLGGGDVICGGDGNDDLLGGDGDDLLFGDAGNDVIEGGAGNDLLDGDDGVDVLDGGDGDDRLEAGYYDSANDTLTGGAGSDTFAFSAENGVDSITDFTDGEDIIDLRNHEFVDEVSDLEIVQDGENVVISASVDMDHAIVVENADVADFTNEDFLFG